MHGTVVRTLVFVDILLTCELCRLRLRVKHILMECSNFKVICEKYITFCSVKVLESSDSHTVINFINKKNIFITSCNVCYFSSVFALIFISFLPFVSYHLI